MVLQNGISFLCIKTLIAAAHYITLLVVSKYIYFNKQKLNQLSFLTYKTIGKATRNRINRKLFVIWVGNKRQNVMTLSNHKTILMAPLKSDSNKLVLWVTDSPLVSFSLPFNRKCLHTFRSDFEIQ